MTVQENAKLTSLNTSKKQLHMEQFLLKTILSLAEQFYNQDWKERCTQNLVGREKKLSGRNPHLLWWDLGSSLRIKGFELYIRHFSPWNMTPERQVILAGLKLSGVYQRVIWNQNSALEECAYSLAFLDHSTEAAGWKLPGALVGFAHPPQFVSQPPAPAPFPLLTKERATLATWILLGPNPASTRTEAAIDRKHAPTHIYEKWN